jgi:hypothetical protein
MTAPTPATRIRNIQVHEGYARPGSNSKIMTSIALHATDYFNNNRGANEVRGLADKARKVLFKAMKDAGIDAFGLDIPLGAGMTALDVAIGIPEKIYMDPAVLFALMGCDKDPKKIPAFLGLVSVTKAAIVEQLGTVIASRCEKTGFGTEDVFVKAPKPKTNVVNSWTPGAEAKKQRVAKAA